MAWQLEQSFICQGCGTASWEWDEDPHAYYAEPYLCMGCQQVGNAQDRPEMKSKAKGMLVGLVRRRPYGER